MRLRQQCHRFLDLRARRRGLVHRQRRVRFDIELDLAHLHVEWKIDQHRSRPAGAHQMERLLEHARHERRFAHRDGPFRHRLGDRLDVDRLKVFLVESRARRLARDAKNGDRVRPRRVQPGDHVGSRGSGRADAYADVARSCARVALRHVRSALDVTRQHVTDATNGAHRGI